jgi:predicted acylesterase/phospholipase RssA
MPANDMSTPRLFRTYSVGKYESFDCAIWEAARATSAAPTFFKRIFIGIPPMREPFVDGGLPCNNPIKQILSEAEHIFPHQHIACIVSIGTGHVTTASLPASSLFHNVIPLTVAEVLKKITTDCETTAEETDSASNLHQMFTSGSMWSEECKV